MRRVDAMAAVHADLERCVVVTIMGAVAAELQSIGHRPNFFYLQHAMGLAQEQRVDAHRSRTQRVADLLAQLHARRPGQDRQRFGVLTQPAPGQKVVITGLLEAEQITYQPAIGGGRVTL